MVKEILKAVAVPALALTMIVGLGVSPASAIVEEYNDGNELIRLEDHDPLGGEDGYEQIVPIGDDLYDDFEPISDEIIEEVEEGRNLVPIIAVGALVVVLVIVLIARKKK